MALNLTNLGRKIGWFFSGPIFKNIANPTSQLWNVWNYINQAAQYSNPIFAWKKVIDTLTSPEAKKFYTDFWGGINDTMNLPSVIIGEVGAFMSPKWSRAEREFKRFADTARWVTDNWQDYDSLGYAEWRLFPALAAAPLFPVMAWGATLGTPEALWIMSAWLWWQESFRFWLPSWMDNRKRVRAEYEAQQQNSVPSANGNTSRKTQIANTLKWWQAKWIDLNDSSILPLVRALVEEYNSL